MEITVQHGSCLLGTCTVIGNVPVKSRALINRQKQQNINGLARKTNFGFELDNWISLAAFSSCFRTNCSLLFRHRFVQMLNIPHIFQCDQHRNRERKYRCGLRTQITSYTANLGFRSSSAFQRPPCRVRTHAGYPADHSQS